jgi:ABC-type multidrug transport system ATPase subunit
MTAWEVVELFARLRGAPLDRIAELFRRLGLEGEEDKRIESLSGGRKQRLALVAALVGEPPILLLDEPTANLDVKARQEFLELLRDLKRRGKTLVFSTHRPSEVRALADRVLHLEQGRLVASGSPAEVLDEDGREVELELAIRARDLDRAAKLLTDHGFAVERRVGALAVRVTGEHKIDPIAALVRHEIAITDFSVHGREREEERLAEPT